MLFYDTSWKKLSVNDFIQLPQEDSFYIVPQSDVQADSLKNLRAYADMYLWKATLSADQSVLSITYTTPDYLDKKTAEALKRYVVSTPLCYEWKNGKFIKREELNSLSK